MWVTWIDKNQVHIIYHFKASEKLLHNKNIDISVYSSVY